MDDQVQWEVERGDRTDNADRAVHREPDLALAGRNRVERNEAAVECSRLGRRKLERTHGALHLGPRRTNRLGRFGRDDLSELLLPLGQQPSSEVEDFCSLPPRQRPLAECGLRTGDRAVDVARCAQRDAADLVAVERRRHHRAFGAHEALTGDRNGTHRSVPIAGGQFVVRLHPSDHTADRGSCFGASPTSVSRLARTDRVRAPWRCHRCT